MQPGLIGQIQRRIHPHPNGVEQVLFTALISLLVHGVPSLRGGEHAGDHSGSTFRGSAVTVMAHGEKQRTRRRLIAL